MTPLDLILWSIALPAALIGGVVLTLTVLVILGTARNAARAARRADDKPARPAPVDADNLFSHRGV